MSDSTEQKTGHGHTVKIIIDGKERDVPWGFTTPKKEESAAKKYKIEVPGTTEGDDTSGE